MIAPTARSSPSPQESMPPAAPQAMTWAEMSFFRIVLRKSDGVRVIDPRWQSKPRVYKPIYLSTHTLTQDSWTLFKAKYRIFRPVFPVLHRQSYIQNPVLGNCTCFGCETKTEVVRIQVIFLDRPMFSHIIQKVSARAFPLMWLNIGLSWKIRE